jgi:hypothetical protein
MWRYADIDEKSMFPYLCLPAYPKKTDSPTAKHIMQFRENVCHHLYGYGESTALKTGMNRLDRVALHHFPPAFRPYIVNNSDSDSVKKQFRWRVPLEVGSHHGLTKRDLCATKDADGELGKTYMCSPIVRLADSYRELEAAEHKYNVNVAAVDPSSTITVSSVPKSSRKSPEEKEREKQLDALIEEAQTNPRALALRLLEQSEHNQMLRDALDHTKKEATEKEDKLRKEMDNIRDAVTRELVKHGGLNRRALLMEEYHASKPSVSRHLFGLPWKEHVARGIAMFGDIVDGFDPYVTGDEPHITPFEKYCICCMIGWRGFEQETVGLIYNRNRSSISRYESEWMPLLGEAGADMSELDLGLDHNYYSKEYCIENGLPYMEGGITHNLNNM